MILFFWCLLFSTASLSQDTGIAPYIAAWNISDKTQSYRSQVFFDSLLIHKDDPLYRKKYLGHIDLLRSYIKKHPDRRLQVRLLMFEIMAAREYGYAQKYYPAIGEAIKMAYPLRDDQLNAELYSIRADIPPSSETHLLYNLKALEIQRRIGFRYFPYTQNRFYGVCASLYSQGEYVRAITYGRECLRLWDIDTVHRDPRVYIFQCDLLGAAYKQLNRYDSARWYYQQILQALRSESSAYMQTLWRGIADGNIGQTYTAEGRYAEALPLLTAYLQNSRKEQDPLNIAMAHNAFARFYFRQKQYASALAAAQEAWKIALPKNIYPELIEAADRMSTIYRQTGPTDSAFYYYDMWNRYREIQREANKNSAFSVIKAQIAFDNLQHSLILAQSVANREKSIRNAILAGIVLLTIIALLLYNKKRVKEQYRLREMELRHANARRDVKEAREKIAAFTRNIIEKNDLIRSLQEQLSNKSPETANPEQLRSYSLLTEEDWEKFRDQFSKAYPAFFSNLRRRMENLTPAMERLAALMFLQLTNYQIANTLGISKDSVARSKRRLRTALNLATDQQMEEEIAVLDTYA
ncbi:Tetratricopeptide repeat-containing protein [Niabella drilacis]|uniref:Tetratricopeptide repeat-containing protein n=1 Tax=Niabella drilacis (strain DSM 25811 / CCM 8410 / CCUG 62505 / LMG 26954 / E90) TaxID=1285928 RepID=A0A1G6NFR7_NIADE|nr:Tetratricopeptide repeat-containing protein [Niabella drilacis]